MVKYCVVSGDGFMDDKDSRCTRKFLNVLNVGTVDKCP